MSNKIDRTSDAIFLPGKIHGCEDEIYIVYENPEANEGKGCIEIGICDYETLLRLYENVNHNADDFFDLLPDYFHGKWKYCNAPSTEYDELCDAYETADFIFGRDGCNDEEMNFIVNWALYLFYKNRVS